MFIKILKILKKFLKKIDYVMCAISGIRGLRVNIRNNSIDKN